MFIIPLSVFTCDYKPLLYIYRYTTFTTHKSMIINSNFSKVKFF